MGRIRTVKSSFFTHELLNDLEERFPELKIMLVYQGLWGQCDNRGVFRWKPRSLKLEILPFVNYDIDKALEKLLENGFVIRYPIGEEEYGRVLTFNLHQLISGSEKSAKGTKYPLPNQTEADVAEEEKQSNQTEIPGMDKWEMIESQLTGDIFIDQVCMTNHFNRSKFTEFAVTWTQNKKNTGDYKYPIPRLRSFMIADFKKENKQENGKTIKQHSNYTRP